MRAAGPFPLNTLNPNSHALSLLAPPFQPIPAALIERIHEQATLLALAGTTDEAIKALFLLHHALRVAEALLPVPTVQQESRT